MAPSPLALVPRALPRALPRPDADLAARLLRQGYDAVPRARAAAGGAREFPARLLGRRTHVVVGEEGSRLLYDGDVVHRSGAVPPPLAHLLFGRGAVHGLDGAEHRERKALLMAVLDPTSVDSLVRDASRRVAAAAEGWVGGPPVRVHDALVEEYGAAVLGWAGVLADPADEGEDEARRRARQLAQVVDGFGGAGTAYARAWAARLRTQRWLASVVHAVRAGRTGAPAGSALALLAASDLDDRTAAVELHNVVRPTVAVARLGTFGALRLVDDPALAARLAADGTPEDPGPLATSCAHEVRRTTPFVPALTAVAHGTAEHAGRTVRPGDRVLLDVPGTDADPRTFDDPEAFRADRFLDGLPGEHALVPQGGGDVATGHRCPGERLTVGLLAGTLVALARAGLRVPEGAPAPEVDRSRVPTLPGGGLLVVAAGTPEGMH